MRKLGPHLLGFPDIDRTAASIDRWKPAAVKSLHDSGYDLRLLNKLKHKPLYYIVRRWWDSAEYGNPDQWERFVDVCTSHNNGIWDPMFAARIWLGLVDLVPLANSIYQNIIYVESFNEVGSRLNEYMQFEKERLLMLNIMGLKSVVCNYGNGRSDDNYWQLAIDNKLIDAVILTGGLVGGHGYGGFNMFMWDRDMNSSTSRDKLLQLMREMPLDGIPSLGTWLTFRTVRDLYYLNQRGYHPKMVITEIGLDNAAIETYGQFTDGQVVGGWKQCIPHWLANGIVNEQHSGAQEYARQLRKTEEYLQLLPDVVGATIFQLGDHAWEAYNIEGDVTDDLIQVWETDEPTEPLPVPDVPFQVPKEIIDKVKELKDLIDIWLNEVT